MWLSIMQRVMPSLTVHFQKDENDFRRHNAIDQTDIFTSSQGAV
jgi:hypothetical protein